MCVSVVNRRINSNYLPENSYLVGSRNRCVFFPPVKQGLSFKITFWKPSGLRTLICAYIPFSVCLSCLYVRIFFIGDSHHITGLSFSRQPTDVSKTHLSRNETALMGYCINVTLSIWNVSNRCTGQSTETGRRGCPYAVGNQPVIFPAWPYETITK